jgi:predicted transcriptional regulator
MGSRGSHVRICEPDDSLSDVAQMMLDGDCACLLVRARNERDRVAGMITDRNICMAAHRSGKQLKALRVEDAMSTEVAAYGLREALEVAGALTAAAEPPPLALLDEKGGLLAIISLVPLERHGGRA